MTKINMERISTILTSLMAISILLLGLLKVMPLPRAIVVMLLFMGMSCISAAVVVVKKHMPYMCLFALFAGIVTFTCGIVSFVFCLMNGTF